jgi:hypothetical protein
MMKHTIQKIVALSILALVIFGASNAMAQQQRPGGRGGQQGGQGGPGGFDPSQFMDMMLDRMQEQLGFSDAEWKAVRPMVQTVMEKQRATRGPGMGGMFGRGGRGGRGGQPGGANADRGPQGGRGGRGGQPGAGDFPEQAALQAAIDSDASAADIKTKLDAYKKAVVKNEAALKKAQDDLRAVLSVKQEAQLTLFGML